MFTERHKYINTARYEMEKTVKEMREDAIRKIGKLDKNSLTLAYNTVTILQARQELEKGADKDASKRS